MNSSQVLFLDSNQSDPHWNYFDRKVWLYNIYILQLHVAPAFTKINSTERNGTFIFFLN